MGTICTVVCRNSGGLHLERLISSLEQERLTRAPARGLVVRAPGPAVVKLAVSLVYWLSPTHGDSLLFRGGGAEDRITEIPFAAG